MREEPLHTFKISYKSLNRKGSTLLSALIMGVIVIIMIFASSVYMKTRVEAVVASSNKMDNRIALDGMLAYTINGIKQNWCFSDTWTHQNTCILTDPRNTARLLLSDESLMYLGNSTTIHPTPLSATRLSLIEQSINLTSINSNHPLYLIARPLDGKYTTVKFTIKRDDSAIASTKGREVRLKIHVLLTASSGVATDDLELDSQIIVYPRELSYFGLIMPGNLYLGSVPNTAGDIGFNKVNVSSGAGIRFESPVFVNKNLHLPTKSSTTAMNNVVFLDKVVLGGGMLYQDGQVYSPANGGGADNMYNHEMKSFSGLLGGYELDEEKDGGLEYLFGTAGVPPTLTPTEYEKCLARVQASYDLSKTKDSQLFMRYNGSLGINTYSLSANIGNIDNLIEQAVGTGEAYKIVSNITGQTAGLVDSAAGGAVFKVKVVFAGLKPNGASARGVYTSEFYLSRTGQVTLTPMGPSSGANVIIRSTPYVYGGNQQYNQVNLDVTFGAPTALDMAPYGDNGIAVKESIKIFFEAQDYAYNFGTNLRDPGEPKVTNAELGIYKSNGVTFNRAATGEMVLAQTSTAWSTNEMLNDDITNFKIYEAIPESIDWAKLDELCMAQPDTTAGSAFYASFPSANWGTSFVKQSEHAWRFNPDPSWTAGYYPGTINFATPEYRYDTSLSTNPEFRILSKIKDCVIKSSANFVTGFYVCETLTIEQRNEPLRIIGTFMTGKLTIHDSAYTYGIRWSSIYSPQALYELRAAKILGKYKSGLYVPDCNSTSLPPLWSPNLGITSALAHYLCNPVSLRTADPFKWTMVDPDCGIEPSVDPMKVACKSQPRRFLIKEISRTKGM